jgi:hypothetical protein
MCFNKQKPGPITAWKSPVSALVLHRGTILACWATCKCFTLRKRECSAHTSAMARGAKTGLYPTKNWVFLF